jgi:hypothetical protein
MSITLDQLDKIVHALNEDIGASDPGYMVSLDSSGYSYGISINGFTLYNPDHHSIDDELDEAIQIERICRDNLLEFASFWADARIRIYATSDAKGAPKVDYFG